MALIILEGKFFLDAITSLASQSGLSFFLGLFLFPLLFYRRLFIESAALQFLQKPFLCYLPLERFQRFFYLILMNRNFEQKVLHPLFTFLSPWENTSFPQD